MKTVFIDTNPYGVKYVREILPAEATPVTEWYNADFASHCAEAPDYVEQNWEYNTNTGDFFEPGAGPKPESFDLVRNAIDQI